MLKGAYRRSFTFKTNPKITKKHVCRAVRRRVIGCAPAATAVPAEGNPAAALRDAWINIKNSLQLHQRVKLGHCVDSIGIFGGMSAPAAATACKSA